MSKQEDVKKNILKIGELVTFKNKIRMVIKELTFKEYCERHDELYLEYDVNEAWDHWQKNGPLFEVIDENGKIRAMWKNNVTK